MLCQMKLSFDRLVLRKASGNGRRGTRRDLEIYPTFPVLKCYIIYRQQIFLRDRTEDINTSRSYLKRGKGEAEILNKRTGLASG